MSTRHNLPESSKILVASILVHLTYNTSDVLSPCTFLLFSFLFFLLCRFILALFLLSCSYSHGLITYRKTFSIAYARVSQPFGLLFLKPKHDKHICSPRKFSQFMISNFIILTAKSHHYGCLKSFLFLSPV